MYNLLLGNAFEVLRGLPAKSVHCCVTSPPYWPNLRDYGGPKTMWPDGWEGCLGDEPEPQQFCDHLTLIFEEVRRVLRDDGLLWVNLGDSYAQDNKLKHLGIKRKDLLGIPWMFAFTMRQAGWILRNDDIWHKTDALPNSATDRTSRSHEYIFQFAKTENYYFDREAIRVEEPKSKGKAGKSHYHRSIWSIAASNFRGGHFATFPEKLASTCIKASTAEGGVCAYCGTPTSRSVEKQRIPTRPAKTNKVDTTKKANRDPLRHITVTKTIGWLDASCQCRLDKLDAGEEYVGVVPATVLDPFNGAATTGVAAIRHGRRYIGIDLFKEYLDLSDKRLAEIVPHESPAGLQTVNERNKAINPAALGEDCGEDNRENQKPSM